MKAYRITDPALENPTSTSDDSLGRWVRYTATLEEARAVKRERLSLRGQHQGCFSTFRIDLVELPRPTTRTLLDALNGSLIEKIIKRGIE